MTDKNKETDREEENQILDPILTSGIGSRIIEAAKPFGGIRNLAEMIDMSEAQLYRITSGKSQAKIEPVVAIAVMTGVNLLWLATGQGPMKPDDDALMVKEGGENPYLARAGGAAPTSAFTRLRDVSHSLAAMESELGYKPSAKWHELIKQLMYSHGLNKDGAALLLDTVRSEGEPE